MKSVYQLLIKNKEKMSNKYLNLDEQIKKISKNFFINNKEEHLKLKDNLRILGYSNYIAPIKALFINYNKKNVAYNLNKEISKYLFQPHSSQQKNHQNVTKNFSIEYGKLWKEMSRQDYFLNKKKIKILNLDRDSKSINYLIKKDVQISQLLFSKLYFIERFLKTTLANIISKEMFIDKQTNDTDWLFFLFKSIKNEQWWDNNTIIYPNNSKVTSIQKLSESYLEQVFGKQNLQEMKSGSIPIEEIQENIQNQLNLKTHNNMSHYIWIDINNLTFGKIKSLFFFIILNFYKSHNLREIFKDLLEISYFNDFFEYLNSPKATKFEIKQKAKNLEGFLNFIVKLRNSIAHNHSILFFLFKHRDELVIDKIISEYQKNGHQAMIYLNSFSNESDKSWYIEINNIKLPCFTFKIILKKLKGKKIIKVNKIILEPEQNISNYFKEIKKIKNIQEIFG